MTDKTHARSSLEKRRVDRTIGNIGATIILGTGERIRCIVRDFSRTGALLIVSSVLGIPAAFDLQATNGPRRRVEVVRRGSGKIGVRFL